jgi:hypothetical protein
LRGRMSALVAALFNFATRDGRDWQVAGTLAYPTEDIFPLPSRCQRKVEPRLGLTIALNQPCDASISARRARRLRGRFHGGDRHLEFRLKLRCAVLRAQPNPPASAPAIPNRFAVPRQFADQKLRAPPGHGAITGRIRDREQAASPRLWIVWIESAKSERSHARCVFPPLPPPQPLRLGWRAACRPG